MYISRQQTVVDKLRTMILQGTFQGGDRLLEIPLSEQLEVSRTPIRETLITLAEEGLVEYRPNRGYVVRSFTLDDIMNAYVVREALESLACRLLAERGIDRTAKQELQDCLAEGDRILAVNRLTKAARDPWGEMNDQFHNLLVKAANNGALSDALSRATNIPYSSSRVVHWFEDDDVEGLFQLRHVHTQHHTIFKAIIDGEGYRAEMVMRGHIEYAAHHIRSTYYDLNGMSAPSVEPAADPKARADSRAMHRALAASVPLPPKVSNPIRAGGLRVTRKKRAARKK
jgi:GntR family transcriptional regulator, vanillate catabolism transcriptional regulator